MSRKSILLNIVISMRPKHWTKNFFVFPALIFSQNLSSLDLLRRSISVFVAFCLISSSTYLINDIADKEKDSKHFKKKNRPIASGALSIRAAIFIAVILVIFSTLCAISISPNVLTFVLFYFGLTFLYSFYLKNYIILDVIIIALGFILRIIGGAVSIGVEVSSWLILCSIFLFLFIA